MFKNKYEADNSRFGEVLTQVLSAHGIGVRQFLAEAKIGKTRFYAVKRGQGDYRLVTLSSAKIWRFQERAVSLQAKFQFTLYA